MNLFGLPLENEANQWNASDFGMAPVICQAFAARESYGRQSISPNIPGRLKCDCMSDQVPRRVMSVGSGHQLVRSRVREQGAPAEARFRFRPGNSDAGIHARPPIGSPP